MTLLYWFCQGAKTTNVNNSNIALLELMYVMSNSTEFRSLTKTKVLLLLLMFVGCVLMLHL